MPVRRRSRAHHGRHVRRHRAGADGARRSGRRSARAVADLSSLHGGSRQDRRARRLLPHRSRATAGCRISDDVNEALSAATRALVVIDPNNPTGATYPDEIRRALIELADRHNVPLLADEVYGDLAYDGAVPPMASLDPDAPIISFSSLSKAYLAPGWRTGWMAVGRTESPRRRARRRSRSSPTAACARTGRWSTRSSPRSTGDRSHEPDFRAALRERAELTTARLNAIDGMRVVAPTAAFYAMPQVTLPPGRDRRRLRARRCCARPACSASTAPASAPGRKTASSASCFSPARTSSARSTISSRGFTADFLARGGRH